MGGSIGFGIRWNDNGTMREVYMDRWTNDLPWRICHPEFINQGAELRALVEEAKPDNEWPHSVLLPHIERGEYGLVLVDFPTMEIYSRNDYSSELSLHISGNSTAINETAQILKHHIERNQVSGLEWNYWEGGKFRCVDVAASGFKPEMLDSGFITAHISCFKIDSQSERYPPRKEVAAWLKSHGWKTPMNGRWKPS